MKNFVQQFPFAVFSMVTVALSLAAYWLPVPREVVPVVMVCVPALVSVALTAVTDGSPGVRALLGKLGQWRLRVGWVLMAVGLALVLRLAVGVLALALGVIDTLQVRAGGPQLLVLAVVLFVFAVPEELGWRGYALPRLLQRHSPLTAGLLIGLFWGSLHLVLHLPGMMNAASPPLATLPLMIALSVLITWLYTRTGGNLIIASLFHGLQSFFVILNDGIPPLEQGWLMAGVYAGAAVLIVLLGRAWVQPAPTVLTAPKTV